MFLSTLLKLILIKSLSTTKYRILKLLPDTNTISMLSTSHLTSGSILAATAAELQHVELLAVVNHNVTGEPFGLACFFSFYQLLIYSTIASLWWLFIVI